MAKFTEAQIQGMVKNLLDDFPKEIATRELAVLELEDLKRKGCLLERTDCYCVGCSAFKNGKCPMNDWVVKHPEYADDELALKIKVLEAGGEEAYALKLKAQEEAKKKAEEEKNKATDGFKVEACKYALNIYFKDISGLTAETIAHVCVDILNASTKHEIEKILSMVS